MRTSVVRLSARVLILTTVAGLFLVGIAWQLRPLWRGDHWLRIYSHDGRLVGMPSFRILSAPGEPAAFASSGTGLIEIPADLETEGRKILVAGPGCGLLHTKFRGEDRLVLPPPLRTRIRVPGQFELPSGENGIALTFHAQGVSPDVASVLFCAPAPATYWDGPDDPIFLANHIWLDPETRSASVLLPCTGEWRVAWTHTMRPEQGEHYTFSIVYGMGESVLTISSEGGEYTLSIDPDDLDNGMGDD